MLKSYLEREQHQTVVLDEIFGAMLERVVMIVSRVQGTYEFEVQPLREYFAARHLYDTASYSPPGGEKGGTKPDRFDALARNFYWLNVTRFFCGCFTKGELLDLADRVKELMSDQVLGRTRHPFLLAAMLLSDWVFSQAPKAVIELTTALAAKESLRRLLPASLSHRSEVIQIPDSCGGVEIVSKSFEFLYDSTTRSDLSDQLAEFIAAHVGTADRERMWLDAKPADTERIGRWLRVGDNLGVLARASRSVLLAALGEHITSPIAMRCLANAGRFDCLLSDNESAAGLIDLLFSRPSGLVLDNLGSRPLYLLPMLCGLGSSDRWRHYRYQLAEESRLRFDVEDPSLAKCEFDTDLELQAFEISLSLRDAMMTPSAADSSEAFKDILARCSANWGEQRGIIALGATICNMPFQKGRKRLKPVGLFQADTSLLDRLRTAKLRAENVDWWREQARNVVTPGDRFLFQFSLFTWANSGLLFELVDEMGQMLEAMEDNEWRLFIDFVAYRSQGWFSYHVGTSSAAQPLPRKLSSKRLALVIGIKDEGRYARAVFLDYLFEHGDGTRVSESFRQAQALDAAFAGIVDWQTALSIIRVTYAQDIAYSLAPSSSITRMPDAVAQQVLNGARDYPVSLWSMAESVANGSARKAVQAVGRIAKADRWFAG